MNFIKSTVSGLISVAATFGVRAGTAEPRFTEIGRLGPVEIRQYAPRLAASVTVAGEEVAARSDGFRRLAAFIFGGNIAHAEISMTSPVAQASAEIAMTSPVAQEQTGDGSWIISFYMPAKFSLTTLPKPTDPGITVRLLEPVTNAVLRFSGGRGVARVAEMRAALLQQLKNSGWEEAGKPVAWFYDPPWTLPWARRNEVAVQVKPR